MGDCTHGLSSLADHTFLCLALPLGAAYKFCTSPLIPLLLHLTATSLRLPQTLYLSGLIQLAHSSNSILCGVCGLSSSVLLMMDAPWLPLVFTHLLLLHHCMGVGKEPRDGRGRDRDSPKRKMPKTSHQPPQGDPDSDSMTKCR